MCADFERYAHLDVATTRGDVGRVSADRNFGSFDDQISWDLDRKSVV